MFERCIRWQSEYLRCFRCGHDIHRPTTKDVAFGGESFLLRDNRKTNMKIYYQTVSLWKMVKPRVNIQNLHMWAALQYIKFHGFPNEKWKCTTITRNCDTWRKWNETTQFVFSPFLFHSFSLWVMGNMLSGNRRVWAQNSLGEKNDTKIKWNKKKETTKNGDIIRLKW